jgi:DNA helicase-2/ATP-dependent DNA helicase PcrA
MDRLAHLNPAQFDAVRTLSGPLLILAGAGTGKTRVITHRMAELIRTGIAPERILAVTFTNKAAREMHERTTSLLPTRLKKKPLICTFHSFCVRVLRQEITALGYPTGFSIYDRSDQESAARSALRDIRVGNKSLRPGDLLGIISRWKMAGVPHSRATDFVENDLEFLAAVAYRKYQTNLKTSGAVDFDDLLLLTDQLFEQFPEVVQRQRRRFDHLQVDEYQDTNSVQFRLVEALVSEHRNICVVGDDDQSIYGWRGADVEHILQFQNRFPGTKVIRLVENYRCTDKILEIANSLVRHNLHRHDKQLNANKVSEHPPRFLEYEDEQTEAESVVREINYLVRKQNVPEQNIAILFRTNEQPRQFETELRHAKLRYILIGGQSFFDRREIRDLLAYMKVIVREHDEASLLRIINRPTRGISDATVQKLLTRAVSLGCPIWDTIPAALADGEITVKAEKALRDFRQLLNKFRRRFDERPKQLEATLRDLIGEINYESEIQKQYKTADQQLLRSSMLDQLVEAVKEYTDRADEPSLAGFLEDTALMGRDDESDKDDQLSENAIKLMTLHCAKGLEFPRVYMVGLEEGLLPHRRSVEADRAAIDEERRLAYVGITRAQDHLTLTRANSRMKWGKRRPSIPSRFLFEMHENHDSDDSGESDDLY